MKKINKKVLRLDFDTCNNKEYKMKAIWDSTVYANKKKDHLSGLYYLVMSKNFPKKNIWKLFLIV